MAKKKTKTPQETETYNSLTEQEKLARRRYALEQLQKLDAQLKQGKIDPPRMLDNDRQGR